MKWLISAALLLSFALLPAAAQKTPRPAGDFAIHMADGKDARLSQYRGKPVVLAFLSTGCPHCQSFAKQLSMYQQEYGPKGVQVLGVVFDQNAKAGLEKFRAAYVKGYPLGYSDENSVMTWLQQPLEQGYFVPVVVFVDRKGMVQSQHMGDDNLFQDPDANIRKRIDGLLRR